MTSPLSLQLQKFGGTLSFPFRINCVPKAIQSITAKGLQASVSQHVVEDALACQDIFEAFEAANANLGQLVLGRIELLICPVWICGFQ